MNRPPTLLVLRAQTGDRAALDELLQSIQEGLHRYLRRLTGDPSLGDDVLQEVFVKVYRKLRWLANPELFRPWTYRIASREALRALERERRWRDRVRANEALDDVAAPQEPPPATDVARPVDRVSPASRAVLILHYLDDLALSTCSTGEEPIHERDRQHPCRRPRPHRPRRAPLQAGVRRRGARRGRLPRRLPADRRPPRPDACAAAARRRGHQREGSGFDLIFDRLLTSGRPGPQVLEIGDSVHVAVPRRVLHPDVIRLIQELDARHQLTQRERIVLGTLAQSEGLRAGELTERLDLGDAAALRPWLGRLPDLGLVARAGRTKATRYFVPPDLLRLAGLDRHTTLARVEPHRLRALILEDIDRYPSSAISEIQRRIGPEIAQRTLRRTLNQLVAEGQLAASGRFRGRRYLPAPK